MLLASVALLLPLVKLIIALALILSMLLLAHTWEAAREVIVEHGRLRRVTSATVRSMLARAVLVGGLSLHLVRRHFIWHLLLAMHVFVVTPEMVEILVVAAPL